MDMRRIEQVVAEEVQSIIDQRFFEVRFMMKAALRKLLWPGYQTREIPESTLMKMDDLVDAVFNTTHRRGPVDESWTAYDETKVDPILKELRESLKLPKEITE
jgi:hypothetical protein